MKKIVFMTTGGTIASAQGSEGLQPSMESGELLSYLGRHEEDIAIECIDLLQLDSSNMQPEEWRLIAQRIALEAPMCDGIVLTHGTDTLGYTSSALSFMLRNIPIPVVLTGSQLPLNHHLSDGVDNIRCAFAMAESGYPGVYVAFNRKVILGSRAVKVKTMGFDAFESVNQDMVGVVDARGLMINESLLPKCNGPFALEDQLCEEVFLMKLTPGFNPEVFDMLSQMNYKGIVIEAFGAGGLHFIRRDLISKLQMMVDQGISVVVCSQCLYERSDFSIYQTGQKVLKQGVIQGFDMTSEACVTKLMWALGKTKQPDVVKAIFEINYVGEITLIG